MDKYEFNIKVEQIKKMVGRGDYETAMKIADTIDWHRVRNASLLSMIAEIYEKNKEYQEAKDILLLAFERAPIGKRLLYKLTDLALKEGSVAEAEAYYREFCDLAQDDSRQYLLRYLILKAKKAPLDQLIRALETYTAVEVDEKWLYELAELYHRGGMGDQCVRTCDKIMLLFGLGKYVEKAMDLKLEYEPLNQYQMDLVENRDKYEAKLRAVEEEFGGNPSYQDDYEEGRDAGRPEEPSYDVEKEVVMRIHEDAQTQKLAQEMSKLSDTGSHTVEVEEDDMDATRTLDDLRSIKEIRPTKRVLDVEAERESLEADREIERQRMAIRAAKAREEMEEEALRRAEEERELARREEEERRARKQAEIDRERAMRRSVRTIRPQDESEDESLELESLDEGMDLNNLMIEAVNDEDGLAAALDALREIHRELGHKNPVAKISSEKLNKRGISAVAPKLAGKDLIIEHAAGLSNAVQNELDELMERDKTGMIVVLIDTPENLEALHGNNMSLASKFQYIGADSRAQEKRQNEAALEEALLKQTEAQEKIAQEVVQGRDAEPEDAFDGRTERACEMPEAREKEADGKKEPLHQEWEMSARETAAAVPAPETASGSLAEDDLDDRTEMELEEFAQYACKYAADIDCSITGKSMLALYERIEMMEEDGVRLTRKAAVDLIEEAADKAEKPSLGRKITGLFSSKYDKEGHLILREDNFFD